MNMCSLYTHLLFLSLRFRRQWEGALNVVQCSFAYSLVEEYLLSVFILYECEGFSRSATIYNAQNENANRWKDQHVIYYEWLCNSAHIIEHDVKMAIFVAKR